MIGVQGWFFLFVVGVLFPFLAWRSAQKLGASKPAVPSRPAVPSSLDYVVNALFTQGLLFALAWFTARSERIWLLPPPTFTLGGWLASAAFLALGLGTLPLRWRWKTLEERRRYAWIAPHTTGQFGARILVSAAAGSAEELAYRGVLFTLLARLVPGWWGAALLCALPFALSHAVQGWKAMVVIVPLALGSQGIVWLTGDLYTAMVVHFVYDVLALGLLGRYVRELGAGEPEP